MPTPELENDECDCGSCVAIRERHFTSGLVWGAAVIGMFEAIRARYACKGLGCRQQRREGSLVCHQCETVFWDELERLTRETGAS